MLLAKMKTRSCKETPTDSMLPLCLLIRILEKIANIENQYARNTLYWLSHRNRKGGGHSWHLGRILPTYQFGLATVPASKSVQEPQA